MPNIPSRREQDYSRFDSMSEEQLQEFLRSDASKPEGEASDIEELLYVMELLSTQRKERGNSRDPKEAFKEFKMYYDPNRDTESEAQAEAPAKRGMRPLRWRQRLLAAAAILAILVGSAVSAGAYHFNLWETIAKWTQETFHFGTAGQSSENNGPDLEITLPYAELQEALDRYKIHQKLLPTWIPDGFVQDEIHVIEFPDQREFHVIHKNGDKSITVQIKAHHTSDTLEIEQSESASEVYPHSGVNYYIFENIGQIQIISINENYECWIYGNLSREEAKEMIDSIEKG